ncbi:MAG TPA: hypothetical protein VFE46_05445 [Pirellulales bacterium]|jgi:hypothetical protein|nr:hypothetical protein [Pirellulales bacterium]
MKSGNPKPLSLFVGGIALVAFMFSVVVAQQQKKAAAPPNAKAPVAKAPTAAGPQSGTVSLASLNAPLKAKIPANYVIKLAPPVAAPAALTLADLKSKTGAVPAATDTITLPNGTKVVAQTLLTKLNSLNQQFAAAGAPLLRSPSGQKTIVQELAFNKPLLDKQAAAIKALPAVDAKAQSLSVASLQKEYQTAVAAQKATATANKAPPTTTAKGAKGTQAGGTNTAGQKSAKGAKGAEGATASGTTGSATTGSGTKQSQRAVGKVPPGEVGPVLGTVQPYTVTKTYNGSWGDNSIFGVGVNCSLSLSASGTGASMTGSAKATGSIFGNAEDLAVATASLNAPTSGVLTANLKVTVLGVDEVAYNASQSVNFDKSDTYSKSLPDSLKVSYNFSICGIPITAVVGAKGSISMPYYIAETPGDTIAYIIPDVQSSVYAQVGIGGEWDNIGGSVGVEVNLTLLNNKLTLAGGGSEGTDTTGTFLQYWLTSRDDLDALAGTVDVYLNIDLGIWSHTYDEPFYNYTTGFIKTFTPVAADGKQYLATSGGLLHSPAAK